MSERDERDATAFAMRSDGAAFRVIAEALGFNAPASARGAVIRGAAAAGVELPQPADRVMAKIEAEDAGPVEPLEASRLVRGVEITVRGEGRFKFDRMDDGGASVTCFGPVNDSRRSWRTFRLDRVRTIHRKAKSRVA